MTDSPKSFIPLCTAMISTLATSIAWAHPGHLEMSTGSSALSGFLHPFSGADHLLAMLAVGMWSALAMRSLRDMLWAPLSFVVLMVLGACLGATGMILPMTEPMIASSLLVFGLLITTRARLPLWASALLCGLFALFHGYAHGTEFAGGAPAAFGYFVAGFAMATALLHGLGIGAGIMLKERLATLAQLSGAGIAVYGVSLLTAAS